jgi:tape measure domain-containing protein
MSLLELVKNKKYLKNRLMANIGDLNIRIGASIDGLQKGLRKAERSLQRSSKKMGRLSQSLILSVSTPLVGLAGAALKASADLETLQVNFETLTGSAEAASKNISDLKKLAASTPFSLAGLAKSQQTMMGFGFSTEEAFAQLNLLGNAAMGNSEVLKGLAVVMGQVKGAGVAMTQDLNQFINQGVPIYQLLGDVTGKTTGELKKMASQGMISFDLIQAGFTAANKEGGLFYKNMEKQSKTLNGVFSTLKDNLTGVLVELGNSVSEAFDLKGLANTFIEKIQAIKEAFMALSPEQKRTAVRMAAIVAIIPVVMVALSGLIFVFSTLAGAAVTVAGVLGTVGTFIAGLSLPVIATVAAIALLTYAFISAYNSSDTFRKGVRAIGRFLSSFIKSTVTQIKLFAGIFKKLFTGDFTGAFEDAKEIIRVGFNKIGDAVDDGRDSLSEEAPEPLSMDRILGFDISSFGAKIREITGEVSEGSEDLEKTITELKRKFNNATDEVEKKKIGSELLGVITAQINLLKEAGKAASDEILALQANLNKYLTGGGKVGTLEVGGTDTNSLKSLMADRDAKLKEIQNQVENGFLSNKEKVDALGKVWEDYLISISKVSNKQAGVTEEIEKTRQELDKLGLSAEAKFSDNLEKMFHELSIRHGKFKFGVSDDKSMEDRLSDFKEETKFYKAKMKELRTMSFNTKDPFKGLLDIRKYSKEMKSSARAAAMQYLESFNERMVAIGLDPIPEDVMSRISKSGVARLEKDVNSIVDLYAKIVDKGKQVKLGVRDLFSTLTTGLDNSPLQEFQSFFAGLSRMTENFSTELGEIDFSHLWTSLKKGSLEAVKSVAEVTSGLFNGIMQSASSALQGSLDKLNSEFEEQQRRLDALNISEEARSKHRISLEERHAKAIAKIKSKQARAEKAAAIAQAIMNTAVAVTSVLANPFLAAAVGALGAAQVGMITAQPIPQFANGGIISGRTLAEVGEYGSAARGNPEVIAPLDKLKSMISDVGGGGHITGEFRLKGDDLVAAVGQNNRKTARFSGNTQF